MSASAGPRSRRKGSPNRMPPPKSSIVLLAAPVADVPLAATEMDVRVTKATARARPQTRAEAQNASGEPAAPPISTLKRRAKDSGIETESGGELMTAEIESGPVGKVPPTSPTSFATEFNFGDCGAGEEGIADSATRDPADYVVPGEVYDGDVQEATRRILMWVR